MEKGHIELGEILFIALLIVGLATAIIILVDGNGNPAGPANLTPNASQNQTAAAAQPATAENASGNAGLPASGAVPAEPTNKTISELVGEGLGRADDWFYTTAPQGNFDIKTNGWVMGLANASPDSIPLKANDFRAADVRFDGRYDDSLRAFTIRQYVSPTLSEPARIYAIALFISNSTLVGKANSTFDIQYDPHPEGPQVLEGCSVLNSSSWTTAGGSPLEIYDITCKVMYGAYP